MKTKPCHRRKCKGSAGAVKAPTRASFVEYSAEQVRCACDVWLKKRGLL